MNSKKLKSDDTDSESDTDSEISSKSIHFKYDFYFEYSVSESAWGFSSDQQYRVTAWALVNAIFDSTEWNSYMYVLDRIEHIYNFKGFFRILS